MKPCPFCGSEARIYRYPSGIRAQVRCSSRACKARGPYVEKPYPFVSWVVDHQARDMEERRALQTEATEKAVLAVKAEAERAWNQRVDQPDLLADPVVRNRRDGVE